MILRWVGQPHRIVILGRGHRSSWRGRFLQGFQVWRASLREANSIVRKVIIRLKFFGSIHLRRGRIFSICPRVSIKFLGDPFICYSIVSSSWHFRVSFCQVYMRFVSHITSSYHLTFTIVLDHCPEMQTAA